MDAGYLSSAISTMRLYGRLIPVVSGGCSVYQSVTGPVMTGSAWVMATVGVIVIAHGVVLLIPAVDRLGMTSGPLIITYAVVTLLNQGLVMTAEWMSGEMSAGMRSGMDGRMTTGRMGVDGGMIAIAVLMLVSGVATTVRRDMVHSKSSLTARNEVTN